MSPETGCSIAFETFLRHLSVKKSQHFKNDVSRSQYFFKGVSKKNRILKVSLGTGTLLELVMYNVITNIVY